MIVDLDAIRALADAATEGPWEVSTEYCDCTVDYACSHGELAYAVGPFREISGDADLTANAHFIAAARTAVPALCDEVAALYAENLRMDDQICQLRNDLTERYMQGYSAGEKMGAAKIASLENTIKFDHQHYEQDFSNRLALEHEIRNLRSTLASAREVLAGLVDTIKKLVPMPTEIQQVALSDLAANLTAFADAHEGSYEC